MMQLLTAPAIMVIMLRVDFLFTTYTLFMNWLKQLQMDAMTRKGTKCHA